MERNGKTFKKAISAKSHSQLIQFLKKVVVTLLLALAGILASYGIYEIIVYLNGRTKGITTLSVQSSIIAKIETNHAETAAATPAEQTPPSQKVIPFQDEHREGEVRSQPDIKEKVHQPKQSEPRERHRIKHRRPRALLASPYASKLASRGLNQQHSQESSKKAKKSQGRHVRRQGKSAPERRSWSIYLPEAEDEETKANKDCVLKKHTLASLHRARDVQKKKDEQTAAAITRAVSLVIEPLKANSCTGSVSEIAHELDTDMYSPIVVHPPRYPGGSKRRYLLNKLGYTILHCPAARSEVPFSLIR